MSLGLGGLQIKRLVDIKAEIETSFELVAGVGNVDLSSDGPIGQIIGIASERESLLWELFELVLAATTDTGAGGVLLDQLYLILNLLRIPAKQTRTVDSDGVTPIQTLTGTPGTVIPIGFELQTEDTELSFFLEEEVTIGAGGTIEGIFASEDFGPVVCLADTLTVIPTPLTGLTSTTNSEDALVGRVAETDAQFRIRRATAASVIVAATAPADLTAVLAVEDVDEAKEIINRSDTPDLAGRPGHSYELVIRGGADSDLFQAIYDTQPSGIETYGNTEGTVIDPHGDAQPVAFSRPTIIPLYIAVEVTVDDEFPTDGLTEIRDLILAYGQNKLKIAYDVSPDKIFQTIETAGIQVFTLHVGTGPNPTNLDPYPIGDVEIAEFDSTRLTITRLN